MSKTIGVVIIDTHFGDFFVKNALNTALAIPGVTNVYTVSDRRIFDGAEHHKINKITSLAEYSDIVLNVLPYLIEEDVCLIVQWDGFVLSPNYWVTHFLNFDYIGAPWVSVAKGSIVGNGGFSLRSSRFLKASKRLGISPSSEDYSTMAEDVIVCQLYHDEMERMDIKFAPVDVAKSFSFEDVYVPNTLGFHGAFNLPRIFTDQILSQNVDEVYQRVGNDLILAKLILAAIVAKRIGFATELLNLVRSDPLRTENLSRIFEAQGRNEISIALRS